MSAPLFSILALVVGFASLMLLPANLIFVGAVALSVGAGVAAAELRRGAGPQFRAAATIGR